MSSNRRPRPRLRPLILVSLLALCGSLVVVRCHSATGPPTPPRAGQTIGEAYGGFSTDGRLPFLPDADVTRQFDLMKQSGAHRVRISLFWSVIEDSPGQYDWRTSDRLIAAAAGRDLEVLALLTYSPSWATGTDNDKVAPRNPSDIGPFARAAVTRYAPKGVHAWEIWNEPNVADSWAPRPDVGAYAQLLTTAAASIRAVDASATIVSGGLAPARNTVDRTAIDPVTFVRGLYDNGASKSFTALGLHPYTFPALPLQQTAQSNGFQGARQIRQVMVDRGDRDKQIWFTEFGAPTGSARDAVGLDVQSQSVAQAYSAITGWPWAGPLYYYTLRDAGTDGADRESNFGLLRFDYAAKPAWETFLRQMSMKQRSY